jgi:hypothetical protein
MRNGWRGTPYYQQFVEFTIHLIIVRGDFGFQFGNFEVFFTGFGVGMPASQAFSHDGQDAQLLPGAFRQQTFQALSFDCHKHIIPGQEKKSKAKNEERGRRIFFVPYVFETRNVGFLTQIQWDQ